MIGSVFCVNVNKILLRDLYVNVTTKVIILLIIIRMYGIYLVYNKINKIL